MHLRDRPIRHMTKASAYVFNEKEAYFPGFDFACTSWHE